jgi:hypothetical protein
VFNLSSNFICTSIISAFILLVYFSRKQVVSKLAKEAKLNIKAKAASGVTLYPSDFILEEVLEACAGDCTVTNSKGDTEPLSRG